MRTQLTQRLKFVKSAGVHGGGLERKRISASCWKA